MQGSAEPNVKIDRLMIGIRRAAWYVGMALALSPGTCTWSAMAERPDLPQLPPLATLRYPPAVRAAVEEAVAAVEAKPRDAAANGTLAMVLHANHLIDEAVACYQRAHLLDPSTFRWAYFLGLIQASQADCEHATATLREALRLDPEYLPAELKLGACLLGSGQWQEASSLYEAILKKHPASAEAHYGVGRVHAVRNDLNGAILSFRKACELFPGFGAARYALGHSYERLGKKDQAAAELALFERDKRSAPRLEDAMLDEVNALNADAVEELRKGDELVRSARFEDAAAAYEKALVVNPRLVPAHVHLISLYGRLGQAAKAEEHFQAAVTLKPDEPESYFDYGLLLAGQEKFPEAEKAFRRTLEINSAYAGAHINLGYMLETQGKVPEALAEYRKAVENDPGDPQAQFNAGRILVHQKNYQEGIQHLLKSLSTTDKESKPSYLYAVGAAYTRSGDRENGLHYLRLARQEAVAGRQSRLVESIDDDLRTLGAEVPRN
ncbi:MAG: hypothetical protein DMG57_36050 [Acidobacteria bacterium]|nr:MAG: hypothetical protein DMG57_36050 [Acidobacteriota bacterium]